jgi:hypothetical protein
MAERTPTEKALEEALDANADAVSYYAVDYNGTASEHARSAAKVDETRDAIVVAARADERAKLMKLLRDRVSGRASEHDAGIRYAAMLIEKAPL